MNSDNLETHERKASWLGEPRKIFDQYLVSIRSYLTLPFQDFENGACQQYFTHINKGKHIRLLFDGRNSKYLDQLNLVLRTGALKDKTILDLGCGNGNLYQWALSNSLEFSNYLGLDFSGWDRSLADNAHIGIQDIRSLEPGEIDPESLPIMVNTLCYLDDTGVQAVIGALDNCDETLLVEPHPGIFWDAHFSGIRLHYRHPKTVINLFANRAWSVTALAKDYGLKIKSRCFFPLSYAIRLEKN